MYLKKRKKELTRVFKEDFIRMLINISLHFIDTGGRKKNIPFRRQRMDIDCSVPPPEFYSTTPSPGVDDPYVADLIHVADEKLDNMQREVDDVRDQHEADQRAIKSLRKQVSNVPSY